MAAINYTNGPDQLDQEGESEEEKFRDEREDE